ncbi:testis-expressed protein 36 [Erinaceus europaeus]|uniref:Testis-expressed protein 36 n=1 Tax=Erinaceus europaeus TaxID=9365 RepID=A0ABM3VRY0_ERIEU|nr:testis-expressed protein 36 [Erinaceus europaeus]
MGKGRRFNPSLDNDGLWFPHSGVPQKTQESITKAMLREPHCPQASQQIQGKLPPIYRIREKQAVNNSFPFSLHDNRHSFENYGYYLDCGLGRRKIPPEKRQQISRNFNLWACDYVPSCLDGFSNNQISYPSPEAVVIPIFRRFPRQYKEIWNDFKLIPRKSLTEFLETNPEARFAVDEKDSSPKEC